MFILSRLETLAFDNLVKQTTKHKTPRNMRTLIGIGTGLALLVVSILVTNLLIPIFWLATAVAFLISVLVYFKFVFPYATIRVPANKAWTLGNSFISESSKELATFSGYRTIIAQKELQAGFHWKFFWEYPDKEVDMKRQIQVENDFEEPLTLRDGKQIRIRWRVFVSPLPGNIINFIRTRPEDIKRRVKDRVDSFLQGQVGGMASIDFDATQMQAIKDRFEMVYGGSNRIDEEERQLGIWTGTPEIIDIDQPEEVQKAKNYQQKMEATIKVANAMVKASKGKLRYDQALKLALVGSGDAKIDFVELAGTLFGTGKQPK